MTGELMNLRAAGKPFAEFMLEDSVFVLRPAYPAIAKIREKDAAVFSQLRKQSTEFFFDDATPEPTDVLQWVANQYDQDATQINVFITNPDGERAGFFGFSDMNFKEQTAEFGRVMKVPGAARGIMAAAIGHGCVWLAETFGIRRITLEVFSDNAAAIRLYQRLGFQQSGMHFRCKEITNGHTKWVTCQKGNAARPVLEMSLNLDQWGNRNA